MATATTKRPTAPTSVPRAFYDYDPICLYRKPEEDAARKRLAEVEVECRDRLKEARAECSAVLMGINDERMRLRKDCPKFDPEFYESVFPSAPGLFGGDGHE